MCIADDNGIPYDFYCKHALEFGDRAGWAKLPTPTQLYSVNMIFAIKEAWKERLGSGVLVTTQNPAYHVDNYEAHPWQNQYQKWLMDQAMRRPNPKYALVKCVVNEPQIIESYVRVRLGADRLEEIKNAAL